MNDNENKTNAPTIKLLPCPFCGGDAEYVCSSDGDYIECTRCGLGTTRHEQGRVNSVQRWNTRNEADALRAEVEEMNELFQAQWEADMRAVKLWQDATGKEFTLPDRTNHVVWLLNRIEFDEKIYAEMREENEQLKLELAAIKPNAAAGEEGTE